MIAPISRSLRRRTTAASAALLLGLTLAACGSDGSDGSDDGSDDPSAAATVPSEDELAAVLLTTDDIPTGFTVDPTAGEDEDDDDDDTFEGTCLADIGQFSDALGADPDSEAETGFLTADETSSVSSQIEAYADPETVASAFGDFTESLGECTSVSATTDEGVDIDLEIAYDDAVDLPGADDQLGLTITGSLSASGQTFPVTYEFSVALAGQFISVVGTYAIGEDTTGVVASTGELAELQAGRVAELA